MHWNYILTVVFNKYLSYYFLKFTLNLKLIRLNQGYITALIIFFSQINNSNFIVCRKIIITSNIILSIIFQTVADNH